MPFFKLIHNGPLQSASLFFVTCLERRKKKGWKGWTLKSRLGNELLVIYSGYRECQCERGLALHKMLSLSMGDNTQFEASCRPCAVAVLLKVMILKMNWKLRHCFVTETCFVPEKCLNTCFCFASGDYIKQFSHKSEVTGRL